MSKLKKILSVLLTLAMMLMFAPTPVGQAEGVPENPTGTFNLETGTWIVGHIEHEENKTSYASNVLTVKNGANIIVTGTSRNRRIVVEEGATASITLDGVDIQLWADMTDYSPLLLNNGSNVTLTLAELSTNILWAEDNEAGIQTTGATLTIIGKGSLEATGGVGGAGIGGSRNGSGGNIIIEGGNITARGNLSAGIGGGDQGNGGNITIIGGSVIAEGSEYAAGIGGGYQGGGGNISISGGTVTATGGTNAAGIGGGHQGDGGTIKISDEAVINKAQGGSWAAGIGSGFQGNGGRIVITGGNVFAEGGHFGAGIGGGYQGAVGEIEISDGIVIAVGGENAAGIGGGYEGVAGGKIMISGGEVKADGGYDGAGIGGGYSGTAGNITISGGRVTSIAGEYNNNGGAGIGGGSGGDGGIINISGEAIIEKAQGGRYGAGIGGGDGGSGGVITISGDAVIVEAAGGQNGAGIGGGRNGAGGNIAISGGAHIEIAQGGRYGAGIGGGEVGSGGVITINGDAVIEKAIGGQNGAGIGGGHAGSGGKIDISGNAVIKIAQGGTTEHDGTGGAGIGGGSGGNGSGSNIDDKITISGEAIIEKAQGGDNAAGIGGGDGGDGGDINISGGNVNAEGGGSAAGIGGGEDGDGANVTISGGTITAIGNNGGAGIGSGLDGNAGRFEMNPDNGGGLVFASSVSDTGEIRRTGGVLVLHEDNDENSGTHWFADNNFTQKYSGIVPEGYTLTVYAGKTFTIAEDVTLTNNGIIYEHENGLIVNYRNVLENKIRLIFEPRTVFVFENQLLRDVAIAAAIPSVLREGTIAWSETLNPETTDVGTEEDPTEGLTFAFTPGVEYEDYYDIVTIEVNPEFWKKLTITEPPSASNVLPGDPLSESELEGGVVENEDGEVVDGHFGWTDGDQIVEDDGDFEVTFWPDDDTYAPVTYDVHVEVKRGPRGDPPPQTDTQDEQPPPPPPPTPDPAPYVLPEPQPEPEPQYEEHLPFVQGIGDSLFAPDLWIIRAEVAQIFYNLSAEMDTILTQTFPDVHIGAWYAEAVNTAAATGLIEGYPDGNFRPEQNITRAEFLTIAMRFMGTTPDGSHECIFNDVPRDHWAYDYISMSADIGWVVGYPDGTFRPNQHITRAEAVTLVNRLLNRIPDREFIREHVELPRFDDVQPMHWAYYEIMEALIPHRFVRENDGTETWRGKFER